MYLIKPTFVFFLQEEIKTSFKDYVTEDENTIFVEKVNISLHFLSYQMSLKVRGIIFYVPMGCFSTQQVKEYP